jgi:hypothetical protein
LYDEETKYNRSLHHQTRANEFVEDGCLYTTPQKFDELAAYDAQNGDILISRAGTVDGDRPSKAPAVHHPQQHHPIVA